MPDPESMTEVARTLLDLSIQHGGRDRSLILVGLHAAIAEAQCSLLQYAQTTCPILISGETGTGKDLFARALVLLSARRDRPFLAVNCAQYQDGHLLAAELFGHRKGSFTGAIVDHLGLFEDANDGTVFLDEVGELVPAAQAMLLRILSEGELVRVGETRARRVDVRVLAATARDLDRLAASGAFREDLYYRLRFLRVRVPPLRERGNDWRLLLSYYLDSLNEETMRGKRFSERSMEALQHYHWPGNVRELRSIVELAFYSSPGDVIEPETFISELRVASKGTSEESVQPFAVRPPPPALSTSAEERYARMRHNGESFWTVVYEPFMDRELNRAEVREILAAGLNETHGSYKRLLPLFGVEPTGYLKFMDFLRHHRLKPFGDSA